MSSKNAANKSRRSALSKFFLANAVSWGVLWIIYVISGIPIVMLTRSVAYDPANMTAAQSFMLDAGNFTHAALRWAFPVLLPVIWLIVRITAKPENEDENRLLGKGGITAILTCAAILLILGFSHGVLPIDRLREGSGIVNNLLIRLRAILTASPVGLAAVMYTMFARRCGSEPDTGRLNSFGKPAVIAAGAMLGVTLVAAFVTVVKGTWMSIDWIVTLPLCAAVIYECARAAREQ